MRLTRTERWILSNQYRILEALYPEQADDFAEIREAVERGYELDYSGYCEYIYDGGDVMSPDESREVIEILGMFRVLKQASSLVNGDPDFKHAWICFQGFDGNNETKQLAYARYFCSLEGGRFGELDRGDDFNSHMPTLDIYRRQLIEWKRSADPYALTKEDVRRIADAAVHPSNR